MTNRELGERVLRLWYQGSVVAIRLSFADVKSYYDRSHPTMLERLGSAVRIADLPEDRLNLAFSQLEYSDLGGGIQLPYWGSFFDALNGEVTTMRFEDYKAIASQTVDQVASVAKTGLALYAVYIVGGLLALYLLQSRAKAA